MTQDQFLLLILAADGLMLAGGAVAWLAWRAIYPFTHTGKLYRELERRDERLGMHAKSTEKRKGSIRD